MSARIIEIDLAIADLQAICNSTADQTVTEIANHAADILGAIQKSARFRGGRSVAMQWYRGALPPDDGVLVLVHCPDASEPVWIGHHDDERGEWLTADGVPVSVRSWAPLPEPPSAEETCEHGVPDGDYCQPCNCAHKQAAVEAGYESVPCFVDSPA